MSVAILERKSNTEEKTRKLAYMQEEEHNARIKRNYAMLINPNAKIDEVLGRNSTVAPEQVNVVEEKSPAPAQAVPAANNSMAALRASILQKPYLVENARADSDIFRADNPINRRDTAKIQIKAEQVDEEEESEDLRPTLTTIQYKTPEAKATTEVGKIENTTKTKRFSLARRDKIIIAVAISVIIALFTLIILNSAIIGRINNNIKDLEDTVKTTKKVYSKVEDEINEYMEDIELKVEEYAKDNGMTK